MKRYMALEINNDAGLAGLITDLNNLSDQGWQVLFAVTVGSFSWNAEASDYFGSHRYDGDRSIERGILLVREEME